jgi:glycosyltransferase involved in cell wall biosynthesis
MIFSVIVPVYNAEKYIKEMLDSIIPQLGKDGMDAELLLIENGSTDNTPAICDEYADNNPFVFCYHYGKIGAYAARKEGIKKSVGQWLIFADADDCLLDNAICEICRALTDASVSHKPFDIVLYNASTDKAPNRKKFNFPFEENKVYTGKNKDIFYKVMCEGDSLNAMWNKCIKRELAATVLLEDKDIFLNYGEDLLQTAAFLDKARGIVYLDEILYIYKPNDNGLTGGYHIEYLPNQETAWNKFDTYVRKWGGDRYVNTVDRRKALTCSIAISKLIYSMQPMKLKRSELKSILKSDFYRKYGKLPLPEWAPEESRYVHRLQLSPFAFSRLFLSGVKYSAKASAKKLLRAEK